MGRYFGRHVISVRGVAYRESRRDKATRPRSAFELSEQVAGHEPESSGLGTLINPVVEAK